MVASEVGFGDGQQNCVGWYLMGLQPVGCIFIFLSCEGRDMRKWSPVVPGGGCRLGVRKNSSSGRVVKLWDGGPGQELYPQTWRDWRDLWTWCMGTWPSVGLGSAR